MISEPEMAGEFGAPAGHEVLDLADRPPAADRRPRAPGPRSRWVWALGGAVLASVLWGIALLVHVPSDRTPDLHGYRLGKDPCPAVRLKSIGAAIAPREKGRGPGSWTLHHAALDRGQCIISLRQKNGEKQSGKGWSVHYEVAVKVALHKKTDPRTEFEAERNATDLGVEPGTRVEVVPDLGDKAYLLTLESGESELRVLEGGAVLSLRLMSFTVYENDDGDDGDGKGEAPAPDDRGEEPDTAPYQAAMISDMRDLMAALKH